MQGKTKVQITPFTTPDEGTGFTARVNGGTEFPVETFTMEPDSTGRVFVSLVVAADAVQVGEPPAGSQEPAAEKPPRAATWGDPSVPDPRESLPGWKPEPGKVEVHFTPGDGDRLIGGLREAVRARMGRGNGGVAGVLA